MQALLEQLRRDSLTIFKAGIQAADPYLAVKNCLSYQAPQLKIKLDLHQPTQLRQANWSKYHLIAIGKAACAMASAAQEVIPIQKLATNGLVITSYQNVKPVQNCTVLAAGHPLPDAAGLAAASRVAEIALAAQQNELLLILLSGGGSALLPMPASNITLAEKITVTQLLLASGATINEINCVRKHLSQIKGGGLAKMAVPADLHSMILSDVLGDDLSSIASGPTIPDESTFSEALNILKTYQVWQHCPISVQNTIQQGVESNCLETPNHLSSVFNNCSHTLIGSNQISLEAIKKAASQLNYSPILYSQHLAGEAKNAAAKLAEFAKNVQNKGITQPIAILAGGETTVSLTGNGKGGRNQEMALAFALAAEQVQLESTWTFLSGGTDGIDGPTDAAGGLVDSTSLHRIRLSGLDPQQKLRAHDSYPTLKVANDLVITGATGTNVADLQIVLLNKPDKI